MEYLTTTPSYGAHQLGMPSTILTPNVLFDQADGLMYAMEGGKRQEHPDTMHLIGLVCEAVLEVVCVSSLGYIAARNGLFSSKAQKDLANLNIYFFTPCLIFSKLAAQLTGEKLTELWVIPLILFVQTMISWGSAETMTRIFGIKKLPQRNFVKAMAVFGNSNSLPLSLVISLSHTITGLLWDKIPNDNDDDVGARGILYLLIFSQLGQAVRWSWGMNTLLRPMDEYTPEERGEIPRDEEIFEPYTDDPNSNPINPERLAPTSVPNLSNTDGGSGASTPRLIKTDEFSGANKPIIRNGGPQHRGLDRVHDSERQRTRSRSPVIEAARVTMRYGRKKHREFKTFRAKAWNKIKTLVIKAYDAISAAFKSAGRTIFQALPTPLQKGLSSVWNFVYSIVAKILSCLNVPLCAIILSILVGSIPHLKAIFYTPGTFVNNTITSAINQLGGVAVPVILFVLGGNLCKSTMPTDEDDDRESQSERTRMVWCSIMCRMLIPLLVMTPILAVLIKYAPISILDDPIFAIVVFLLTGAPSALQLAQICQVNDVFVPVISELLVQSYVVWIFPSTLVLVMIALEVVKWANNKPIAD